MNALLGFLGLTTVYSKLQLFRILGGCYTPQAVQVPRAAV